MASKSILVLRLATILIIFGTLGKSFASNNQQNVPVPNKHSVVKLHALENMESRGAQRLLKSSNKKKNRLRTVGTTLEFDGSIPDPTYTFHHVLDYWPYNKYYTTSFFGIIDFGYWLAKFARKAVWFLTDILYLSLKIAYQVFDIFQMRKSFVALSQHHGPGWGEDDDDWRQLRSLGTSLLERMLI